MMDINKLHAAVEAAGLNAILRKEVLELIERLRAAEKERDALRTKIGRMETRLRLILDEPENTMSNSKAMREMIKQARLALEESK